MADPESMPARSGDHGLHPYRKLDTVKRRRAGIVYASMAAGGAAIAAASGIHLLWLTAVAPLLVLAGYQFLGGWRMKVSDMEAITMAGETVSFDVGHGSATLGFRGFRARPVWQVLVFGDGPVPRHQALVTIDAVSSEITGIYEEEVAQP